MQFWVYMLHCYGGRYYVGHTDNLERRLWQHQNGIVKGFTSVRLPIKLVWCDVFASRIDAKAMEHRLKGWSRAKKMALIRGDWEAISKLAKGKAAHCGVAQDSEDAL